MPRGLVKTRWQQLLSLNLQRLMLAKGSQAQQANLLARFAEPLRLADMQQWISRVHSTNDIDRLVALEDLSVLCKTGLGVPVEPVADLAVHESMLRSRLGGCPLAETVLGAAGKEWERR